MKKNTCGYAGKIANVGSQQLQARVLTSYAGLTVEYIQKHTVLLGAE